MLTQLGGRAQLPCPSCAHCSILHVQVLPRGMAGALHMAQQQGCAADWH